MGGQKVTDDQIMAELRRTDGHRAQAARNLGLSERALLARLQRLRRNGENIPKGFVEPGPDKKDEFVAPSLPDDDIPVEQLVEHMKRRFEQKRKHEEASRLIPVKMNIDGPIGILHFGDPHVDDDGTDIGLLERHALLVRNTPGLFAANVGDTANSWVGRLARLYSEQATSASQAWKLAEWFVGLCPWLYMIGGNHDLWHGAGDPLKWITRSYGAMYRPSECRIELQFTNGAKVRVNARHDFSGSSIWNPAHGPMKALTMGVRDHVAVAGHKHESAYAVLKDPDSSITMHALRVASYKTYDRFAKEKGFRDMTLSPCALTTIDPYLRPTHPDLVKVFWDPEEGVDYLKWKRRNF
ncbi:MAG: hypothetical protein EBV32_04430 [Proteobacteria bacterium]|jgi:hypothetical protein|uniref:DNA binding HTH domain-containing protein n=1 Tax=Candidatus Fonsibacter lacus TaxID=2576439 RepID=A0A964UYW6_9PROT|nr:hypothetical protein [Candidatus Fonsibacter lacus]NCU72374.1 hypothetical protein [Candidatus Fonsibacter lacus]